jgi:Protein of unknown function (DUF2867)
MTSTQILRPLRVVTVPVDSALSFALSRIDFVDAYEVQLSKRGLHVNEAYGAIFCFAPAWIRGLMHVRGHIAARLGLKHPCNSHDVQQGEYPKVELGQRIGPFTVQAITLNELIVGDDDKHLNFRISTMKTERDGRCFITVSTAVEIHNTLGRVYMFVVKPFHKFLAPYMVRRAALSGRL